jgi:hypothetical protein
MEIENNRKYLHTGNEIPTESRKGEKIVQRDNREDTERQGLKIGKAGKWLR